MVAVSMQVKMIEGYDSMQKKRNPNRDINVAMKNIKNFLEEQHEKYITPHYVHLGVLKTDLGQFHLRVMIQIVEFLCWHIWTCCPLEII